MPTRLKPTLKRNLPERDILRLGDLANWRFDGTPLAVLGHPVQHSVSPEMHNAALQELADRNPDFKDWHYFKFDIEPERLREALALFHENNFKGLNLTVPHKILAARWIEAAEPEVRLSGACNTLLWTENGYQGYNTDLYGMTRAIEESFALKLRGKQVLLIGAGGAARAAAVACLTHKAGALHLTNRTQEKLYPLVEELAGIRDDIPIKIHPLAGPFTISSHNLIVINATSLGLKESDPAPAELKGLHPATKVFDMIYNPSKTALLKQAESLGLRTANGLPMLVFQGERSFKIWTRNSPSVETMFRAAVHGLAK